MKLSVQQVIVKRHQTKHFSGDSLQTKGEMKPRERRHGSGNNHQRFLFTRLAIKDCFVKISNVAPSKFFPLTLLAPTSVGYLPREQTGREKITEI